MQLPNFALLSKSKMPLPVLETLAGAKNPLSLTARQALK